MKREHPSNLVHLATNYFDALTRHEDALRYEQPYLDEYDREHGTATDRSTFVSAMHQVAVARAIWTAEHRAICAEVRRLTQDGKQRAAAQMRAAGLDDTYADACESDDFGLLAI